MEFSESELEVQDLWKLFFKTIAVRERASYKRQRQMLKLYFRDNMVEFKQY
jgi:hypothetical protein